jgi:glycosyltransferase involved in cell wall biosynthesis
MASHLPVIVTDNPGNREWVEPRRNGWLAPAGDVEKFQQAILEAAQSSMGERRRMGLANRERVESRADWKINFPRLLAVYKQMSSAR